MTIEKELQILSNKARYIQELLDDTIDLRKKKKDEVFAMLKSKGYDVIDEDEEYKYLVKMAMDSVTSENVEKLLKEVDGKQTELHIVKSTTIQQMWLQELGELEEEYIKYRLDRERALEDKVVAKSKKVVKSQSAKKKEPTDFIID